MKKQPVSQFINRFGLWSIPLLCTTTIPLILMHWPLPEPSKKAQEKASSLPPLNQIQSISDLSPTPNSPSRKTLQKPQLKKPTLINTQDNHSTLSQTSTTKKIDSKTNLSSSTSKNISKPSPRPSSPPKPPQKFIEPAPDNYQPPALEIRVAILRDERQTTIGASDQATILDRDGKLLKTLLGNQGWSIRPKSGSLSVGKWSLPEVIWVKPTPGNLIFVGDRWYRGKILLVSQGNSLLGINYVDLEHYLYSVVGSEMHANAPTEALKAQAIAARSYALVHMIRPASAWFDLGNTQRWQVYKGLNSEYNTTHHAVQETLGQILSHKGGVVESLYAATDEIVSRAHKGRGMSQTGAYELAKQGYDYQQILDYYYPGTSLARLVLNN